MRLATGAWCVALVVLINYYCSILFAFIMAPSFRPLVDSVQELAFTEDVGLVVVKNYAVDISISVSALQYLLCFFILTVNNAEGFCGSNEEEVGEKTQPKRIKLTPH